jgi:non-specific serine/threonine protein kinase
MDEASAKKLLHELVSSTIPEYIIEGSQYLLDSGGVQKISVKKGDGYWDISGTMQGEDFQIYSPKISLDFHENSTNFLCNCPEAFSGACRHVGAAALKFIPSLEEGNTAEATPTKPRSDWRQNFRSYFATELEPEAGRHYLLYRFHPEPGRLQVSFFRARQNKSGLSTVHNEITIQQILDHPDWHEQTPGLAELLE